LERANRLIGREVLSSDNQKLGKVDNLVVDLESARILYAIVGVGGVAGVGEKKFAVPPGAFAEIRGNAVYFNGDKQKLNGAPQFTKNIEKETELSKADFVNQSYQYFGQNPWWQGSSGPASAGEFHNVHKASDVIGMKVKNVSDQDMGKVDNLIVDLSAGRLVYITLAPDASLGLGNNLYALPPMFTLSSDKKSLTADINKEKLSGAPHFTSDSWPNLSDRAWASQVYQYYGKQAYFDSSKRLQPTGRTDQFQPQK